MGIFACRRYLSHMRIVVVDGRTTLLEQFHELKRGAFADIGNVPLERQPKNENARPAERHAEIAAESAFELADHIARHRVVDLAGKLDETGRQVKFARFPGEIKRIDRNAMPAKSGSR